MQVTSVLGGLHAVMGDLKSFSQFYLEIHRGKHLSSTYKHLKMAQELNRKKAQNLSPVFCGQVINRTVKF